jgi:arsenate reductase
MEKKPKVLFLSIGNSTRSEIAEGFLRRLAGDGFDTASVGTASEMPDSLAVQVMSEVGIDLARQKSESVRESLTEHFALVVSIFDARRERAPIFPSVPKILRWNLADPSAAQGPDSERLSAYRRFRDEIQAKVQAFLAGEGRTVLELRTRRVA